MLDLCLPGGQKPDSKWVIMSLWNYWTCHDASVCEQIQWIMWWHLQVAKKKCGYCRCNQSMRGGKKKKITLQPFRPYFCTFSDGLRIPTAGAVPLVVVGGILAVKPIVQEVIKICKNFLGRGHRSGWSVLRCCFAQAQRQTVTIEWQSRRWWRESEGPREIFVVG